MLLFFFPFCCFEQFSRRFWSVLKHNQLYMRCTFRPSNHIVPKCKYEMTKLNDD